MAFNNLKVHPSPGMFWIINVELTISNRYQFVWLLGSISTFAFYQFSQSCSSPSLLALSAVEFACLVGTLFIVSILVLRTVRREESPDVLFPTESGDTKYSRRWGSLYGNLKPSLYWWYMPDIMAVLVRSAIVSFAQVMSEFQSPERI